MVTFRMRNNRTPVVKNEMRTVENAKRNETYGTDTGQIRDDSDPQPVGEFHLSENKANRSASCNLTMSRLDLLHQAGRAEDLVRES